MRLVTRRARGAKALLLAAAGATLIATVLLTGLAAYSRDVVIAGARSTIASAPPEERSVLIRSATGGTPAALEKRDAALRERLAGGLAGAEVRVSAAGYASGQLTGDIGTARPDSGGLAFASIAFLDGLAAHADLTAGAWPRPGAASPQTALAERAASILGVRVGDTIPVTDRRTGTVTELRVTGIWRPGDPTDAYWRLTPEVAEGVAPLSAAYGPMVIHRDDFAARYAAIASAGWLVAPDLADADLTSLRGISRATAAAVGDLPGVIGLGDSGQASTRIDRLADRLQRGDLVGRSALFTPVLLVVVLGGYALLLIAVLLGDHRRAETALLRARGAARGQLAGLALREAAVVVLPGALIAPPLATEIIRYAERTPLLSTAALHLRPEIGPYAWAVAALAAGGCVVAMIAPALRRAGTYVAELAGRSRPARWAAAQRASLDVALVAFAVLAWSQLRQYASPLAGYGGRLGIDPLLAAAPTVGVLAGAVIALRLLPPATRLAERYVDRRSWTAAMLGMWQAGRRPHAGPVLLLALAVAASALAWSLSSTAQRSIVDQANHHVGADLRLIEATGAAPPARTGDLASLPGVGAVQGAWREAARYGAQNVPGQNVALDVEQAAAIVRVRDDLADGSARAALDRLAAARIAAPLVDLPAGARRLTGRIRVLPPPLPVDIGRVDSSAVVATASGGYRELPLGAADVDNPLAFDVALPDDGPKRLVGFVVSSGDRDPTGLEWRLTDLTASADRAVPVDLAGVRWGAVEPGRDGYPAAPAAGGLTVKRPLPEGGGAPGRARMRLGVVPAAAAGPVPVLATPAALDALRLGEGGSARLGLFGAAAEITVVGVLDALPGVEDRAALLVDLPSIAWTLFSENILLRGHQEWWVATRPGEHAIAAGAAGELAGVAVLDRGSVATDAAAEPYGVGARGGLFAAALGAILLAAVGIAVDVRATSRRRITELAVLHTLGAGPRLLARALIAEQALLAGMGVAVGLLVGLGVAAAMGPSMILAPTGDRPVPPAVLDVAWTPIVLTSAGLLVLAVGMSGLVATTMRQRLAAAQLRIGDDR
jgi:hypothetical protein